MEKNKGFKKLVVLYLCTFFVLAIGCKKSTSHYRLTSFSNKSIVSYGEILIQDENITLIEGDEVVNQDSIFSKNGKRYLVRRNWEFIQDDESQIYMVINLDTAFFSFVGYPENGRVNLSEYTLRMFKYRCGSTNVSDTIAVNRLKDELFDYFRTVFLAESADGTLEELESDME